MATLDPVKNGLPPEIAQDIEGADNSTASTILSSHRTRMSIRRTGLSDLRSHLANERTHLAYLRTCISLVGFGVTINRFSLFLQEKERMAADHTGGVLRSAEYAGGGMVVIGIVLLLWSLYRYMHVNHDIEKAQFRPLHRAVVMLTALLLISGVATTAWLFAAQ